MAGRCKKNEGAKKVGTRVLATVAALPGSSRARDSEWPV